MNYNDEQLTEWSEGYPDISPQLIHRSINLATLLNPIKIALNLNK